MHPSLSGPLPGPFRWSITFGAERPDGPELRRALTALVHTVREAGGGPTQLWIEAVDPVAQEQALDGGFEPYRDLLQMRCPLPAPRSTLPVRSFTDADAEAFLAVNNRAFHWHPEQGGWTIDDLRQRQAEPWYDPHGFLLYEESGELRGFCWTKVHRDHEPPLGEIFAIAIDPSAHGRGLGVPMTLAGLGWLADQGLTVGMLFVESDNAPAVATYERIGFSVHHVNRAYRLDISGPDES